MQIFVDKREGCDGIRRAEVAPRNLSKLCAGTDKELAQLRRKYAANSTITQILNQFEPSIEAFEAPAPKRKTGHRPNKKETETTTYK
jgi:hypothetical protein